MKKEKDICKNCLYSEYDYDGNEAVFLGCRRTTKKCKGAIQPKTQEFEVEHNGVEYAAKQFEWLSDEGVSVSVNVFVKESDGEWRRFLHAGHCNHFLDDAEIKEVLDFAVGLTKERVK